MRSEQVKSKSRQSGVLISNTFLQAMCDIARDRVNKLGEELEA